MAVASEAGKKPNRTTVSIEKARATIGRLVNRTAIDRERYVVTRGGLPAAAIVSMADLERLEQLDEVA